MLYYLLAGSILAASLNNIVLNKAQVKTKSDIFVFNFFGSIIWCIVLFAINSGHIFLNGQIILWGVIYGLTQTLFILFKTASLSSGPVSITTLIGNCSLLISIVVSLVVWKEKFSVYDIIGLALLIIAICLCTYKKSDTSREAKWKYLVVFFFVFAASVGIVFKAFGKSNVSSYSGDMIFVSAVVMMICNFVACMSNGGINLKNTAVGDKRKFMAFSLAGGLLSLVYNRLNIFLTGNMDAIIFFPGFNGGVIILSTLLSRKMCNERLDLKQKVGIVLGTGAIVLIGVL